MGKIAVILMDGFEDEDYLCPVAFLRGQGYRVIHVGLKEGQTVKGKQGRTQVKIDRAARKVFSRSFDALLIPRGYTFDSIRAAKDVIHLVEEFLEYGKPVLRARPAFLSGALS